MGKINKNSIFSKFSIKAKKQKKNQKQAIEHAQEFTRKMEEGKKKAREDFMNKMLQNAVEMNKAREEWEELEDNNDEEQKEEN